MYGIESQILPTIPSKKTSWVVICRGQNRFVEDLPHLEPGPNPTSKELLRERAVAKGSVSSAAEMNQSHIEETHAQQELVPSNPVCFVKETILMEERKSIDIPVNKWHQEDALSTEISKLVMRLERRYDQDESAVDGAVHWDSMGPRLRNAFLKFGRLVGK